MDTMTIDTSTGPRAIRVPDEAWQTFLKEKGVAPWYSLGGRFFLPGAFTRTDGDGEPDEQDIIWFKAKVYDRAKQAVWEDFGECRSMLEAYEKDGFRGIRLWMALQLAFHEWMHNLVPRHDSPELDKAWLEKWCSHPTKPLPAFRHARETHCSTNAFTRVLRLRMSIYRRKDFLAWIRDVKPSEPV